MKTRIVLAGLMATMMVLEVSAQREYDDMYFRGKDREKNKAIEADEAFTPVKKKKQTSSEVDEDYYANPTDSYSARNVNPEYVSRSNSEQASDDEANYYSEDYQPATPDYNYNNSYYNNANWAQNSFYANSMWNRPYYGGMGMGFYDPWMSPYGGFGYDPWMSPMYGYGMGPGYGWGSRWSMSFGYGNYWGPSFGYGFGNGFGNAYYGYGNGGYGYGYPNYYYGGGYYESGRGVNYGKRPTQNSSGTSSTSTRPSRQVASNSNNGNISSGRSTRTRQSQDEYYVRPSRRATTTPLFDNSSNPTSRPSRFQGGETIRSRGSYNSSQSPSYTPSSSPSSSPSRGSSGGGSSGGGGGGGARPRGRG